MFNKYINFRWWLDSNHVPLVLEATALPTEPQPLPVLEKLVYNTTKEASGFILKSFFQSFVNISSFSYQQKWFDCFQRILFRIFSRITQTSILSFLITFSLVLEKRFFLSTPLRYNTRSCAIWKAIICWYNYSNCLILSANK